EQEQQEEEQQVEDQPPGEVHRIPDADEEAGDRAATRRLAHSLTPWQRVQTTGLPGGRHPPLVTRWRDSRRRAARRWRAGAAGDRAAVAGWSDGSAVPAAPRPPTGRRSAPSTCRAGPSARRTRRAPAPARSPGPSRRPSTTPPPAASAPACRPV